MKLHIVVALVIAAIGLGRAHAQAIPTSAGLIEVRDGGENGRVLTLNGITLKTENGENLDSWSITIAAAVPSETDPRYLVVTTSTGGNACDIWGLHVVRLVPGIWVSDDLGGCGVREFKARLEVRSLILDALTSEVRNEFGDPGILSWRLDGDRLRVVPRKGVPSFWRFESLHPFEFMGDHDIRRPMAESLRERYRDVRDRLTVSSGMVVVGYRYLVGEGCLPHSCGSDEAFLLVDAYTGHTWAFMAENSERMLAFGPQDKDVWVPHVPQLDLWLASWNLELETRAAPLRVKPRAKR